MQAFVRDARSAEIDYRHQPYDDDRLYALDYLTGQLDRNEDGALRTSRRFPIAIDNSMIEGFEIADKTKRAMENHGESRSSLALKPVNLGLRGAIFRALGDRELIERHRDACFSSATVDSIISRMRSLVDISSPQAPLAQIACAKAVDQ